MPAINNTERMIRAARTLLDAGFSVHAVNPDKTPRVNWKPFQTRRMTADEVTQHFTNGARLAIICGKISGNLECLDFDDPGTYEPFLQLLGELTPGLPEKLTVRRKTPSGGYHIIYRCAGPVKGNQKLARLATRNEAGEDTRIETRGEGGYILSAPSLGYEIISGSLRNGPVLAPEEVEAIHRTARVFDEKPEQKAIPTALSDGSRPGDIFNGSHRVADILAAHGWKPDRPTTAGQGWTRPGKESGVSGVLLENSNFYVWTSNAHPLEPGQSYSAFALFTMYDHGGDFSAAAKSLACEGYREPIVVSGDDDATIQRLATLSTLQYDRERKKAAEAMGVRPATLDKMVQAAKKEKEAATGLTFDDIEPWPDSVNGADLLSEVAATVRRFIICQPETAHAVALWAAMTWFMDVVQVAPLAVITAPEKRCGKSQLLFLLGRLVYRPLTASNISTAALFRTIDAWRPTMLVDEADSFMKENEDMRGLLNSGHTRDGAYIIRVVGDDHEPKRFNTWGAKALAGIGRIADTLMDRAVVLELRRKLLHEQVVRLRYAEPELFETLAEKLCRFAEDHQEAVRKARPDLPAMLNDRAQDNWEPLLAIADVAGGQWPSLARAAALKLSGTSDSSVTIGVELLSDIQEIFGTKRVDRITTADLILFLCHDDEKPWATYNRGFPIKPRQVARKLSEYGIKSNTIRVGPSTAKGYKLDQFAETFLRYLTSPPSPCVTPSQPALDGHSPVTESEATNIID